MISTSRKNMREFKVNDYITLKLQNNKTNIYVKNRRFTNCMYLLMNIHVDRVRDYDQIDSIDEAAEILDKSLEGSQSPRLISPEEEFVGHCSNIQAWAENNYDTRILHRNLAFPLLKRLSNVGDPIAKKRFKEEIALRYSSGHTSVIMFLTESGYLKYLSSEELGCLLDDNKLPIISNISHGFKVIFNSASEFTISNYFQRSIHFLKQNLGIHNVPFVISNVINDFSEDQKRKIVRNIFNYLKTEKDFPIIDYLNRFKVYLDLAPLNTIKYDNRIVGILNKPLITLSNQNIEEIRKIKNLKGYYKEIEELDLSNNNIKNLEGIEDFTNLKRLNMNNNKINYITDLDSLKKLEYLSFRNNNLSEIQGFAELINLEHLDLSGNIKISKIPDSIHEMQSLKILKLNNCQIKEFSEVVSNFFWDEQNYMYFSDYSQDDIDYYESSHKEKARSKGRLYKKFVEWVLNYKPVLLEFKLTYKDIVTYETSTGKKAIWNWSPTKDFKRWLFNRSQTLITSFL